MENVKAYALLPAGEHGDYEVTVVVAGNHRNRAAGRSCMARLVSPSGISECTADMDKDFLGGRWQSDDERAELRNRVATKRHVLDQ